MKQTVLAIDVMGGDQGPKATLEGVAMASKIYPDVKFKLFGDMTKSQSQLKKMDLQIMNLFTQKNVSNQMMNQLMHSES